MRYNIRQKLVSPFLCIIFMLACPALNAETDSEPELKAKLVSGMYKIGIFVLKGNRKTHWEVVEFSFKWKKKNYKYEFVVKHKGMWFSSQTMDYYKQARKGDTIIIKDIVAKDPEGNILKPAAIKRVVK